MFNRFTDNQLWTLLHSLNYYKEKALLADNEFIAANNMYQLLHDELELRHQEERNESGQHDSWKGKH